MHDRPRALAARRPWQLWSPAGLQRRHPRQRSLAARGASNSGHARPSGPGAPAAGLGPGADPTTRHLGDGNLGADEDTLGCGPSGA
eukprot:7267417-Alexandrium_andersonii.AAC.1